MTSLTNAKKLILILKGNKNEIELYFFLSFLTLTNKDIIRIIESNTGDRSSSVFDYFSYTDIPPPPPPPNYFFTLR